MRGAHLIQLFQQCPPQQVEAESKQQSHAGSIGDAEAGWGGQGVDEAGEGGGNTPADDLLRQAVCFLGGREGGRERGEGIWGAEGVQKDVGVERRCEEDEHDKDAVCCGHASNRRAGVRCCLPAGVPFSYGAAAGAAAAAAASSILRD